MSRAYLVPVYTFFDTTVSSAPFNMMDFLGTQYIDSIAALVIQENYQLTGQDVGFPELLSYKKYGTTDYWWVLAMYNGCVDPLSDMNAGDVWGIPSLASIQQLLVPQVGNSSNTIGSVVVL